MRTVFWSGSTPQLRQLSSRRLTKNEVDPLGQSDRKMQASSLSAISRNKCLTRT